MADKNLRITFNGICLLSPTPPRNGDRKVDKAYVLMAANRTERKNDWDVTVEPHFPFIYVPVSILAAPIPKPDETTDDPKLGKCNIYFVADARVVVEPTPAGITYFIDERPLAERPGSDDVAPQNDIRWLIDFRDILQGPAPLKKTANPLNPDPDVAVVVDLDGGVLQAGFPCQSVQPTTFKDAKGNAVEGLKRVLASEFFIDIPYAETTSTVKIKLQPLRRDTNPSGLGPANELVLKWPEQEQTIALRMGNDTRLETTQYLGKPVRCNARTRDAEGKPVLVARDNDFVLHYQIVDAGKKGIRVPDADIHQVSFDGCKGGTGG